MNKSCCLTAFVVVAGGAFVAGRYLPDAPSASAVQPANQPQKKEVKPQTPAADPAMAAMMEAAKPGAQHKVLESLIGTWKGGGKFWMAPGTEGMPFSGTADRHWGLNNHYVFEEVHGDPMPGSTEAFEGNGVIGYNTIEKRYEFGWIDNQSTWLTFSTGTYDEKTKTFTFKADELDPMTGKRRATRTIIDVSKPDVQTMTGYAMGSDGKEFKNFEGEFKKTK